MYLKRLEVQGFKTFASRTVFEFKPGTTAIVGPNGSGKSNSADLIRWVLGEQSHAALRCKRTADLIYSGGGKRAPAGLAEATLTIDNADRVLPLAFDEVTISRRATRAGDNEYLINKARVRLRDVQVLAQALGGSYTIINQGMVDAVLTLRAEDRRRLFEDAAGIGGFEARQAEAERRLRETDANLARVTDLLAEAEPGLRSLKRQAGLARLQHELSDELRGLLAHHYRRLYLAAQAACTTADAVHAEATASLAAAGAEQARLAADHEARLGALRAEREQLGALHRQSATLHQQAEAAQRDLAVGGERLSALTARVADALREHGSLAAQQAEAQHELAQRREAMAVAEEALRHQRAEAEQAAHEQATGEHRAAQAALDAAQQALLQATSESAAQHSRAEQIAARRVALVQAEANANTAAARLTAEAAAARQAEQKAAMLLAEAEEALAQAGCEQQGALAAIEEGRHQRGTAEEALAQARRTLADVEARIESLDRLRRSHSGAFAGVRAALEWAERNGRPGFTLVSSLLATPAGLEIAIESALGARLQNIVVEQWHDAEAAIVELKRSGSGRATFLPLDSLRPPRPSSAPSGHGVLGVAADLVGYDPHYRDAVAGLLGRVLLVEDLPAARQALRRLDGGWTLVTRQGEQVSSGGAVTGGAQGRDGGTLRRERELRELPAQAAQQRQLVVEREAACTTHIAEAQAHEGRRREAQARLRAAEEARHRRREALAQSGRRREEAERAAAWQAQRQADAQRENEALAAQEAGVAQQRLQGIAARDAAQARLAAARHRLDAAQAADAARQQRLGALRAALANAEAQARTARDAEGQAKAALHRRDESLAAATTRQTTAEAERQAFQQRLLEAEQQHNALLAAIATLQTEITPAEQAISTAEQSLATRSKAATLADQALRDAEAAHGRAGLDAERAHDRLALVWERAAADDLDAEQLAAQASPSEEPAAALDERVAELRQRLQRIGPVNSLALDEYDAAQQRHTFLAGQVDDLQAAAASLRTLIAELETTMEERFMHTFTAVAREFEGCFTTLFGGGSARLLLAEQDNSANDDEENGNGTHGSKSSGVEIIARPPGKKPQHLALLSGGERSLTAVALLFAILRVNPTPFCVLDEVDAALDEANVGRFRDALSSLAERTQFVVITHNRGTIEAADTLYGVSMNDDGSSRVLSLTLQEAAA